jgi:ABC-type transport system involved in cytochrome c biogenesis permease component
MNDRPADSTRIRSIQLKTLALSEIRRSLFSARALPLYLLVGMPIAVALLRALFMPDSMRANPSRATTEFAEVFNFFLLRFVVFFSNALIFVRLFRGEILEQSLHYTLLAPLPRRVTVLGKYLGGLISALLVLVPATVLTYFLIFLPHGARGLSMMTASASLGHLARYVLIVVLACISYGALFLLAGLYFKNPMVPAVLFLGWELLTPFLPQLLKGLSLVHYLVSFIPVPVSAAAFSILARPVTWWVALLALAAATAALVFLASLVAGKLEISYSAD